MGGGLSESIHENSRIWSRCRIWEAVVRTKQNGREVSIGRGLFTRGTHLAAAAHCRTLVNLLELWVVAGTVPDLCIPERNRERDFDSSHVLRIVTLSSMAIPPEDRPSFCECFSSCVKDNVMMVKTEWGNLMRCDIHCTDISWIAEAYGCRRPQPLCSPGDMFLASSGMQSGFMNNFYIIMDVILNMCFSPEEVCGVTEIDPDEVVMVRAYKAEGGYLGCQGL